MKFLYPEFLYGLFALIIPVIIHLFNFRKSKKVYFSSTRFLKEIKKSTRQKRQIKQYLILLSRLLFITALVMAFAQPYVPSLDKNPQSTAVYIYLDNSQSMSNRVNAGTGLAQGISYVQQILDIYPTNTSYRVLTNDFAPFSNAMKSSDEVADYLTELKMSNVSRSMNDILNRLKTAPQNTSARRKDIFIISDFQKSTFGSSDLQTDTTDQVFLVPVWFDQVQNVAIDSAYLTNPFLMANEKNKLNIVVRNTADEEMTDIPVKLFINDVQAGNTQVSLPGRQRKIIEFDIGYNLKDINRGRISLEEYPVTFDNDFYFVLRLHDKINILEIKDQQETSPVEEVYGNTALFSFISQTSTNVDYSLIGQSDLVIVNGLQQLDRPLVEALSSFRNEGGGLMVIPGADFDQSAYAQLVPGIRAISVDSTQTAGVPPDMSNPFFDNIFEGNDANMDMPKARPVAAWNGQQIDLLSLRNNLPLLSTFAGNGPLYVLSTPLQDAFTNFYRHALFVPVMYRIAIRSKKTFEKPYFLLNDPDVSIKLDSLSKTDIFKLKNAAVELIPNQHIRGNELVFEIPKNELQPGFYNLVLDDVLKTTVAFDRDNNESMLAQLTGREITAAFPSQGNVTLFDVNDTDNFIKQVKKNKFGVPLWKYAVILALIFLLAEVLLIRFL